MAGRRHWQQQSLSYRAKDGSRRHGTPGNAGGRKRIAPRAQVPHHPRPAITRHQAAHVTLRLASDLGNLRRRCAYQAIRRATIVVARAGGAAIVHLSIQSNHLHLIVEANNAAELGEGMRRFAISAARQLNAVVSSERDTRRTGRVFTDRYHVTVIAAPKQARHAFAYVLNNWRHHGADRTHVTRRWQLDPFSSAIRFRGWREVPDDHVWAVRADYEPLVVEEPRSWLLRVGWRHCGRIALAEVPGGTG